MRARPCVVRLAAASCLLCATFARADQFDLFGYGPRASAMQGAMTAEASDYTAVYYNPALLVQRKDINFGFHFQWYRMFADVQPKDLARPVDCTYCTPPDSVGYSLGLAVPLGGKVKDRVAIGVGVYLPSTRLLRLFAPDANLPYWYLYNSNPDRIMLHLGVGVKITDWLNVGAGVQGLADLVGKGAHVTVDIFSKSVLSREIDSTLLTRGGPVFGVWVSPLKNLRFGAVFRWEIKLIYQIPASVDIRGVGELAFAVTGVAHYTPHNLALGAAWDITPNFTVSLDGQWMNWSAAPSPYSDLSIKICGATLDALGLCPAFNLNSPNQKPGFSDTINGRLGVEYRVSERFAARAGVSYRPTMVPKQDAAGTNLLDGDTVGFSAGVGFNFNDPLEIFKSPIQIDLAAQGAVVLAREANKDPTDSVPSYGYSSRIFGVNAAVRYDF